MRGSSFAAWEDVLAYVREYTSIYYQAPLDYKAVPVDCEPRSRKKIRIIPQAWSGADAFTADSGHLERLYRDTNARRRAADSTGGSDAR